MSHLPAGWRAPGRFARNDLGWCRRMADDPTGGLVPGRAGLVTPLSHVSSMMNRQGRADAATSHGFRPTAQHGILQTW